MHKASLKRISKITNVLVKHGLGYFVQEIGLKWHLPFLKQIVWYKKPPENMPVRVRKIFEELGGAFIKLGQLLALRPDLVPKEYCAEFRKLLDEVPPMPFSQTKKIVEDSLDRKLESVFPEFDRHPIGSASIAQVHKAKTKSGKHVVVKVRRESVKESFAADIEIMYWLAHKLERRFAARTVSPLLIVKEFERYTRRELNFMLEARNIDIFHSHFKKTKNIIIPEVFWQYTTDSVLTMEYLDGVLLSKILAQKTVRDRKALARRVVDLAFSQVLELGVFHADLHPGNILVMKNNKIGLIDFGIIGTIDQPLRDMGLKLYIALVNKDVPGVIEQLLTVGEVSKETDVDDFKLDVEKIVSEWHGRTSREVRVTQMMQELLDSAIKHKIKMPAELILLGKALVTAEGTAVALDPSFNFVEWAEPKITRILKKQKHPVKVLQKFAKASKKYADALRKLPSETLEVMEQVKKGIGLDINYTDIRHLGMDLNKSSNRLAYALVIAALLVSGALLVEVKPFIAGFSVFTIIALGFASVLLIALIASILHEGTQKFDPHRKI